MPADLLFTLGAFILALGILITFHEFGHFIVAKSLGVKILRFSVGFGRPLVILRRGRDDTEFVVAALPFGGYVKMLDEREGEVAAYERHRAFNHQSLGARSAIVLAGPLFNFMLAIVVYAATYAIGVDGLKPVVGEVEADGPAATAGIERGDVIVAVDGRPTPTWESVLNELLAAVVADRPMQLELEGPQGRQQATLDPRGIVDIDAVGRGSLFSELGFEPRRLQLPPVLGQVVAGEAADRAGLRPGDRIVAVDGESIDSWFEFRDRVVAAPGEALTVTFERGAALREVTLTPSAVAAEGGGFGATLRALFGADVKDAAKVGRVGAGPEPMSESARAAITAKERYGPAGALLRGVARTVEMSVMTLTVLKKMVVGEASVKNISGPLSIAHFAGESASLGFVPFLSFLALVSVSLGVLNLLPIPVLDGGHLVYYLIEFVFGKPASLWVEGYAQQLGLVTLLALMGLAVYNDVTRLVLGG